MGLLIQRFMMKPDIKKEYTKFHLEKSSDHLYPTEWVIRTMLGNYPELSLDRSNYRNAKILDLGFGDGRNFPLLNNCGLEIFGVETTEEVCSHVKEKFVERGVPVNLKVGNNTEIPFTDNYFDFVLASSSMYYVDGKNTFDDNLKEVTRVLKPGGWLIANFIMRSPNVDVIDESFILDNCQWIEDGHFIVKNDLYGIRNGYKMKCFNNQDDLSNTLGLYYQQIGIGSYFENHYGVQINGLISAAQKK